MANRSPFHNANSLALVGLILIVGLFASGCGPHRPAVATVSGTVSLDDKPVAGAEVMFVPNAGGRPASAVTNEQGVFQLSTFGVADGALVGEHRVAIAKATRKESVSTTGAPAGPLADPTSFTSTTTNHLLPIRYSNIKTSNLSAIIEPGSNQIPFKLTTR